MMHIVFSPPFQHFVQSFPKPSPEQILADTTGMVWCDGSSTVYDYKCTTLLTEQL